MLLFPTAQVRLEVTPLSFREKLSPTFRVISSRLRETAPPDPEEPEDPEDPEEPEEGEPPPLTRTILTAFLLPSLTRMLTVPLATGVTLPLLSTVAMAGFSLTQV